MVRSILAFSALAAFAAPVAAATYSATLAAPATERYIARDIVWACGADACRGSTDASRPAVLCQSLARHAGKIDSFIVDGRPLDGAALARCNTSAKVTEARAIAAL
jgi:hypothetical protein